MLSFSFNDCNYSGSERHAGQEGHLLADDGMLRAPWHRQEEAGGDEVYTAGGQTAAVQGQTIRQGQGKTLQGATGMCRIRVI